MTMAKTSDSRTVMSTVSPASAAADLRLRLPPARLPLTMLDGAWWPRTADPVAELPALIRAVQLSRGYLSHLMLHADGWDSTPRRIDVDGHVVRVAWFTSGPVGLLTTTCHGRDRVDLLVVPPGTADGSAEVAMAAAADAANTLTAPQILAAITPTTHLSQTQIDRGAVDDWESEGGLPHHSAA
jgi:hypothetical protein